MCPVRSTPTTNPKPPRRPASTPASASSTTAALAGCRVEPPCRLEEQRRVGLARESERSRVEAVDPHVEQLRGVDSGEHGGAVLRRRDDRSADSSSPQAAREVERRVERLDPVVAQLREELLVLPVAEAADGLTIRWVVGLAARQDDAPGGEEPLDAVVTGPPVDVAHVVLVGEGNERLAGRVGPASQVLVEQGFPRGRVHGGRTRNDAVRIEDDGRDPLDRSVRSPVAACHPYPDFISRRPIVARGQPDRASTEPGQRW